mgnify:CR=1 FL=1
MFEKASKISRKIEVLARLPENPQTFLGHRSRQAESKEKYSMLMVPDENFRHFWF